MFFKKHTKTVGPDSMFSKFTKYTQFCFYPVLFCTTFLRDFLEVTRLFLRNLSNLRFVFARTHQTRKNIIECSIHTKMITKVINPIAL